MTRSENKPGDREMVLAGERVALRVAYQGAQYSGWQRQPNATTVQELVEGAISQLLQQGTVLIGASRTDAGVHAMAQWAHFDLPRPFSLKGLVLGTNRSLPSDVRVLGARHVSAKFHAQRSAKWKRYRYRLARHRVLDPLSAPLVARSRGPLDERSMKTAASLFLGRHDFSAFAKSGGSHDDPMREIYSSSVRQLPREWVFDFEGDGFLRGMVRALVGTLIEVGLERRSVVSVGDLLRPGRSRCEAGAAAPANGLVLDHIEYPSELFCSSTYSGDGGQSDEQQSGD